MNASTRDDERGDARTQQQQPRDERTRSTSNGEAAGGDRHDVPGGAYNVPADMTEEVSEDPARKRDQARPSRS
ncbi:hypothetical protein [Pseudomonas sp.]|uniref:hypothetical protein n=1 Tax=Pseudomonas sp. TaxID=306 RepID=UPI0028A9622D|nr:hypothetical protein [Pseudomonas sp.]